MDQLKRHREVIVALEEALMDYAASHGLTEKARQAAALAARLDLPPPALPEVAPPTAPGAAAARPEGRPQDEDRRRA